MAVNIGPRIGIDGEAEFRKQINNLIQQQKTLASEMKAVTSAFDKNDKSQESLTAQAKVLNQQIQVQQQRVAKLQEGLAAAAKQFGETDTRTQKWQQSVNEATADLNRMKSQLSSLENGVDDVGNAMESASREAASFGDVLKANVIGQAVIDGVKKLASYTKDIAGDLIENAAAVKAQTSQFSQTFKEFSGQATTAIKEVADSSNILDTRLNGVATQIYAFAKASGGDATESMDLMAKSLQVVADGAAYYDKSLEETAESLQSFLKGNYENDAALGLSATETTRNAAAMELFGEKFNDLTEIQKQKTLLQMVVDAQKLSGAMGQAAREADGWENVQGNLNEAWKQFTAAAGEPVLESVIPVVKEITESLVDMTDSVDWDAFGRDVTTFINDTTKALKDLKPAFVGVGTAAAGMGIVSAAASAKTALASLLASINPVALGITGLVAVTAAATAANIENAKSAATIVEVDGEREKRMRELQASYEGLRAAASERAAADMAEIANVERLYGELKGLATVNGEVTEANRGRAEFILSQLNSALGTEYELTGNVIENYQEMDAAIKDLMETKQAEILLASAEDAYAEAIKNRAEVQKNTATSYAEMVAQQNAVDETRRKLSETISQEQQSALWAMDEGYRQYVQNKISNLTTELQTEEEALTKRQQAYADNQELLDQYYADIATYESAAAAAQEGNTDKVLFELDRQEAGFKTAKDIAAASAQEQTQILTEQYQNSLLELYLYAKKFEAGTKGYTSQGVSDLAQFALDAGEEAKNAGININDNLSQQLSAISQESSVWGADMVSGFGAGIRNNLGGLLSEVQSMASSIRSYLHFSRPDVGPLRDYEQWMPDMMMGMAEGIRANAWRLEDALNAATSYMSSSIATPTVNGIAAGGTSNISITINAPTGMDVNALADVVAYRLQTLTRQKEAVW